MRRGLFTLKVSSLSCSLQFKGFSHGSAQHLSWTLQVTSLFSVIMEVWSVFLLLFFGLKMSSIWLWTMLRYSGVSSMPSQEVVPVTALMQRWEMLTAFSLSHRQRGRWLRALHCLSPAWKHGQAAGADKVHQKGAAGALQGLQKCRSGCSVSSCNCRGSGSEGLSLSSCVLIGTNNFFLNSFINFRSVQAVWWMRRTLRPFIPSFFHRVVSSPPKPGTFLLNLSNRTA